MKQAQYGAGMAIYEESRRHRVEVWEQWLEGKSLLESGLKFISLKQLIYKVLFRFFIIFLKSLPMCFYGRLSCYGEKRIILDQIRDRIQNRGKGRCLMSIK